MRVVLTISIAILFSACSSNHHTGNRSGTITEDYIEEPLSSLSLPFEDALITSNEILSLIELGEYETIFLDFFDQSKEGNLVKINDFSYLLGSLETEHGKIIEYKENQWGFVKKSPQGKSEKYLYSVKIVKHQEQWLDYFFVFELNGDYKKIIGFYTKVRSGARHPSAI